MELEIQRRVKQVVSIETPAYYKYKVGGFSCITKEETVINVSDRGLSMWTPADGDYWKDSVSEKLSPMYEPCTKEEFEAGYQKALLQITGAHDSILLTA